MNVRSSALEEVRACGVMGFASSSCCIYVFVSLQRDARKSSKKYLCSPEVVSIDSFLYNTINAAF